MLVIALPTVQPSDVMIPIGDNIPNRSKPIANYLLIGINLALFLWELKLEVTGELGDLVNSWGIIPARISTR